MKNNILVIGVLGALLGSGFAMAGRVETSPVAFVSVSGGRQLVRGSLRNARFSGDTVQYIGCAHSAYSDGTNEVACYARNAAGSTRSCVTTNADLMRTAAMVGPATNLQFLISADGVSCEEITSHNYSSYL